MFAQIIPIRRTPLSLPYFDYIVPPELESKIVPGQLVVIPFRSREEFGIILHTSSQPTYAIKSIKSVTRIVHEQPFLTDPQLAFLEEMSTLYHVSLGFITKGNLPPLQKRKLEKLSSAAQINEHGSSRRFEKPTVNYYASMHERNKFLSELVEKSNGQCLLLVPEVADAVDTLENLPPTIQKQTAIVTSNISNKDLFEVWRKLWQGEIKTIIGTRRALFLPWTNLETIILDDEGNESNKSWDMAPRFHTRDAATLLAKHHASQLYLLGHTPSLETYYFAEQKIYSTPSLTKIPPPFAGYTFINMNDERHGGNYTALSEEVQELIASPREGSGDIVLFLNRRGASHYIACGDCKKPFECSTCKRPLTYFYDKKLLVCHFCTYQTNLPDHCPLCSGVTVFMTGAGTQEVEKEVRRIAKNKDTAIIRIDTDAQKIILPPRPHRRIIIGTDLAWRYIDWGKTSAVVFVDADSSLFVPEFKVAENVWQTLRTARFRLPEHSSCFIQTRYSDQHIFQALGKPELFYKQELSQRKLFGYPPYYFLLRLYCGVANRAQTTHEATRLYHELGRLTKGKTAITITPPLDMFPALQKGKYWQVLLIKLGYREYKQNWKLILSGVPESWKVDPNPNTILST